GHRRGSQQVRQPRRKSPALRTVGEDIRDQQNRPCGNRDPPREIGRFFHLRAGQHPARQGGESVKTDGVNGGELHVASSCSSATDCRGPSFGKTTACANRWGVTSIHCSAIPRAEGA